MPNLVRVVDDGAYFEDLGEHAKLDRRRLYAKEKKRTEELREAYSIAIRKGDRAKAIAAWRKLPRDPVDMRLPEAVVDIDLARVANVDAAVAAFIKTIAVGRQERAVCMAVAEAKRRLAEAEAASKSRNARVTATRAGIESAAKLAGRSLKDVEKALADDGAEVERLAVQYAAGFDFMAVDHETVLPIRKTVKAKKN